MSNVTQKDRDAAAAYMKLIGDNRWSQNGILSGGCDNTSVTLAFANHRIAAEKAVLDRLETRPMNPIIDMAFEKWRVLLTGNMVREIIRAALETKR